MTIRIDEVKRLSHEAHEFAQQQRQQDLFSALRTATEALEEPVDRLDAVSRTLSETQLGDRLDLPALGNVKTALERCASLTGDNWDPRELRDSGALQHLKDTLADLVASLETDASSAWRAFLDEHPIPKIGELAELLREIGIDELARDLLRIQNAVNRLERASQLQFPSPDELAKFEEDLTTAGDGAARIGLNESLPPAVTEFLRKVAQQGADLDSLTPEVSEWIQEHDLAQTFLIVARSS